MSLDSRSPTLLGTNVDVPSIDVKVKFSLIQLARGFAQLATIGHTCVSLCFASRGKHIYFITLCHW
jgi:hypothetical protein